MSRGAAVHGLDRTVAQMKRRAHHRLDTGGAADTLPKLLARNAAMHPDEVALREKELGIWRCYTWADYEARVRRRTLGLAAIGVKRGEVVGLIGDNRPDWIFGELAAHALGALSLGVYRDALDEEAAYLLNFARVGVVLVEDEEQADKLLGLGERLRHVTRIIYSDPRGMKKYADPRLMPMAELDRLGEQLGIQQAGFYEGLVQRGSGDDPAILCTTSGTTPNHFANPGTA